MEFVEYRGLIVFYEIVYCPSHKLQRGLLRTSPEKTIEMILFRTKVSNDTFVKSLERIDTEL